jgi:hypothetical protein
MKYLPRRRMLPFAGTVAVLLTGLGASPAFANRSTLSHQVSVQPSIAPGWQLAPLGLAPGGKNGEFLYASNRHPRMTFARHPRMTFDRHPRMTFERRHPRMTFDRHPRMT